MTTLQLTLPWPPTALSPNTRQHWSALSRAKKAYRNACAITARQQGAARSEAKKLHVSMVFVPPTRRAYDLDNLLARMKSGLDGLADVLGVDDRHWKLEIDRSDEIGGFVRVEVSHG